jgi:CRISPR-associated protein Cas1
MATLYVTEPGAQVHKEGERVVIRKGKEVLDDIPLLKLDRLMLVGRGVSVTTAALYALTQREIDVVYVRRGGSFVGRVSTNYHKHARLRYTQALSVSQSANTLPIAQTMVMGKIHNQRVVLQRQAREAGRAVPTQVIDRLAALVERAGRARDHDELRGVEGKAAADYFSVFPQLVTDAMGFQGRAYYPPPDPLNALLSLGYTLLLRETESAVITAGLDPALGVLHVIDYGRPSLALDLEEEFRPVLVDSLVMQAVNSALIGRTDFDSQPEDKGWHLAAEPRKRFLALYEARLATEMVYPPTNERTTWRRALLLQAQLLARVFLGEAAGYEPVVVR